MLALAFPATRPGIADKNFAFPVKKIPTTEVAWIEIHRPKAHVYAFYDYGGYVVYLSNGRIPIFIDGRADTAYPPEVIKDYMRIESGRWNWERIADARGVDTFLISKAGPLHQALAASPRWTKVFSGAVADVFVKQK